jgi:hypothetical protein
MSSDRNRLYALVDALPEAEVQVAISFLSELGEEVIVDAETQPNWIWLAQSLVTMSRWKKSAAGSGCDQ